MLKITKGKLYVFTIVAVDHCTNQSKIVPNLLIAVSPQSAVQHGIELAQQRWPGCEYQVFGFLEIPEAMIQDIKRLV